MALAPHGEIGAEKGNPDQEQARDLVSGDDDAGKKVPDSEVDGAKALEVLHQVPEEAQNQITVQNVQAHECRGDGEGDDRQRLGCPVDHPEHYFFAVSRTNFR